MNVYDFSVKTKDGGEKSLADYKGKVLVIVNVASKCGLTPQYEGLQALYEQYKEAGLEILGFPCNQFLGQEPGTNEEIQSFCQLNYGVTFPVFTKIDVNGKNADPLFKYLRKQTPGFLTDRIKWNFNKFLIDREGNVVKRVAPRELPESMKEEIERLLGQ